MLSPTAGGEASMDIGAAVSTINVLRPCYRLYGCSWLFVEAQGVFFSGEGFLGTGTCVVFLLLKIKLLLGYCWGGGGTSSRRAVFLR